MSYRFVVIFAEDPNDSEALEHLLRHLVPGIGTVKRLRQPLVLMKGRPAPAARRNAEDIAKQVRTAELASRKEADLVIAHQDCDAIEPAHVELGGRIKEELERCGIRKAAAAAPAWELEAWWYLWPDAVAAVCGSWRHLTRTGAVGMLTNVKEQLRRDLRPTGKKRVPDYDEADGPRIAKKVRDQGKPPRQEVRSASYEAFLAAITPSRTRRPG